MNRIEKVSPSKANQEKSKIVLNFDHPFVIKYQPESKVLRQTGCNDLFSTRAVLSAHLLNMKKGIRRGQVRMRRAIQARGTERLPKPELIKSFASLSKQKFANKFLKIPTTSYRAGLTSNFPLYSLSGKPSVTLHYNDFHFDNITKDIGGQARQLINKTLMRPLLAEGVHSILLNSVRSRFDLHKFEKPRFFSTDQVLIVNRPRKMKTVVNSGRRNQNFEFRTEIQSENPLRMALNSRIIKLRRLYDIKRGNKQRNFDRTYREYSDIASPGQGLNDAELAAKTLASLLNLGFRAGTLRNRWETHYPWTANPIGGIVSLSGRGYSRSKRSQTQRIERLGRTFMPLSTIRADIDFAAYQSVTKKGITGIRVWLLHCRTNRRARDQIIYKINRNLRPKTCNLVHGYNELSSELIHQKSENLQKFKEKKSHKPKRYKYLSRLVNKAGFRGDVANLDAALYTHILKTYKLEHSDITAQLAILQNKKLITEIQTYDNKKCELNQQTQNIEKSIKDVFLANQLTIKELLDDMC